MRIALAFLLSLPVCVLAEELNPHQLTLKDWGPLTPWGKTPHRGGRDVTLYHVIDVGEDWLAIRATSRDRQLTKPATFIIRGVSTDGIVDDAKWEPAGLWVVDSTEKYKGKTVFVLRRKSMKD